MRAVWLWYLSPHWSPALIRGTWLAGACPSSPSAPCSGVLGAGWRGPPSPVEEDGSPPGVRSSFASLLRPPHRLWRCVCRSRVIKPPRPQTQPSEALLVAVCLSLNNFSFHFKKKKKSYTTLSVFHSILSLQTRGWSRAFSFCLESLLACILYYFSVSLL